VNSTFDGHVLSDFEGQPSAILENPAFTGAMRVVAIGGGTGLSTLLRGLKRNVVTTGKMEIPIERRRLIADLAAVVTVTDDGGSSAACAKTSTCCPRATCATAWWR